jgi:hypothetical protein
MSDNQKRVLEMLAEKKISVDEAYRLLTLVGPEEEGGAGGPRAGEAAGKRRPKYLRVSVQPTDEGGEAGAERVNIRVPVALIRAGMNLASLIPSIAVSRANEALKEKGLDLDLSRIKAEDLDQLVDALNDLEVDVKDKKERVRIHTE